MKTCTAEQRLTAQLRYECFMHSFLINEYLITQFFSGFIVNFVKHVRSTSPDMMLVNEELCAVQALKERRHLKRCG
ncbi:hypothetical protein TNCV_4740701 [Trichonephila clavipes]|nr:hypothetical protein TNCV_4740701 [Trichonephila clavipes]